MELRSWRFSRTAPDVLLHQHGSGTATSLAMRQYSKAGSFIQAFCLSRSEPFPLPSEIFPKSALTHLALWAGPEGSTCSASLPFKRDSCVSSVVLKIIGMNDENWTLGCFTFFQYHLVVMAADFSLLLYLERGIGRRWVLVLWVMTQKHQKESLFSFLFGILWGPAVFRKSSYSTTGT